MPFSTGLTRAQVERLVLLGEELGEAQQVIGKILRHGIESYDPTVPAVVTNRTLLEKELGDVLHALDRLCFSGDVRFGQITRRADEKAVTVERWLHFQQKSGFAKRGKKTARKVYPDPFPGAV